MALAALLPDERVPPAESVMDRLRTDGAFVPALWPAEIGNGLLVAHRRGRISDDFVNQTLKDIAELPISVHKEDAFGHLNDILRLAREYDLTFYDATYLELAGRLHVPLASLDKRLIAAAVQSGVAAVGT